MTKSELINIVGGGLVSYLYEACKAAKFGRRRQLFMALGMAKGYHDVLRKLYPKEAEKVEAHLPEEIRRIFTFSIYELTPVMIERAITRLEEEPCEHFTYERFFGPETTITDFISEFIDDFVDEVIKRLES